MHLSSLSQSSSASPFCLSRMRDNRLYSFRALLLSPASQQRNWQEASCLPVCLPVLCSLLPPPPSVITSSSAHKRTIRWGQGHKHGTSSSHHCGILNSPACKSCRPTGGTSEVPQPAGQSASWGKKCYILFHIIRRLAHPSLVHHLGILSSFLPQCCDFSVPYQHCTAFSMARRDKKELKMEAKDLGRWTWRQEQIEKSREVWENNIKRN